MIDFSDFDRFLRPAAVKVTPKRRVAKTQSKSKYNQLDLSTDASDHVDPDDVVFPCDGVLMGQEIDEFLGVNAASGDDFVKLIASELGESTVIADNSDGDDDQCRGVSFAGELKRQWSDETFNEGDHESYKKRRLSCEYVQSQEVPRTQLDHDCIITQNGLSQKYSSQKLIIKNKKHRSPLIENLDGKKEKVVKKKKNTKKLLNTSLDQSLVYYSDSEEEVRLSEDSDGEARRLSRKVKNSKKFHKLCKVANHKSTQSYDHDDEGGRRLHLSDYSHSCKPIQGASSNVPQRLPPSIRDTSFSRELDQDHKDEELVVIEDSPSQLPPTRLSKEEEELVVVIEDSPTQPHPPRRLSEEEEAKKELATMPKMSLLGRSFERMERRLSHNKWVRQKPDLARPLLQVLQRWKLSNLNFSTRHSTLNTPKHPLVWLRLEITSEPMEEFQRVYIPTKLLLVNDHRPPPTTLVPFTEGRNQIPPSDSTILLVYHQPVPLNLRLLTPGTVLHLYQDWLIYRSSPDDSHLKAYQFFILSGYNLEIGEV